MNTHKRFWLVIPIAWLCVAAMAHGQVVVFSLDAEGSGSGISGNPWASYAAAPVPGVAGSHVGLNKPSELYLPPDDNLDGWYFGSLVVAPVQTIVFSLDEQNPNVEIYRTVANGISKPTGVTEVTLGLNNGSNIDAFDFVGTIPNPGTRPGDYTVDVPDPANPGVFPPGESEDIYRGNTTPYVLSISGTGTAGPGFGSLSLQQDDNVDALGFIPASPHIYGFNYPLGGGPNWPSGWLFSVDQPSGGSGLNPGYIYWSDGNGNRFTYLDNDHLGLPDGVDIDAIAVLGTGTPPPWLVPEPSGMLLLAAGLLTISWIARK